MGSSPLARGKSSRRGFPSSAGGFIPTRAGKMGGDSLRLWVGRVHPHSRGENPGITSQLDDDMGSSPLARGKLYIIPFRIGVIRFIPTRAGKI